MNSKRIAKLDDHPGYTEAQARLGENGAERNQVQARLSELKAELSQYAGSISETDIKGRGGSECHKRR